MATFSLHIHHMDLKDQLSSFYTKDRFKFTGLLGIFMSFVTLIGKVLKFLKTYRSSETISFLHLKIVGISNICR